MNTGRQENVYLQVYKMFIINVLYMGIRMDKKLSINKRNRSGGQQTEMRMKGGKKHMHFYTKEIISLMVPAIPDSKHEGEQKKRSLVQARVGCGCKGDDIVLVGMAEGEVCTRVGEKRMA